VTLCVLGVSLQSSALPVGDSRVGSRAIDVTKAEFPLLPSKVKIFERCEEVESDLLSFDRFDNILCDRELPAGKRDSIRFAGSQRVPWIGDSLALSKTF